MIKVKKDLTGKIFYRLKVIKQDEDYIDKNGKHKAMWLCECLCEDRNIISVRGDSLSSGHTKSCGCLQSEKACQIGKLNQKHNKRDLSGDYGIIWSNNTNEEIYFDLNDSDAILKYNWNISKNGYVYTSINREIVLMHQFLGCTNYDHHNRNKLDNRRENLVPCTVQENARNGSIRSTNTSGFIGVYQRSDTKKWGAFIGVNEKRIHLGYFTNKKDAIKARLEAEAKYFKEFSPQRHLFEEYGIN